jgi:hypothetical protein
MSYCRTSEDSDVYMYHHGGGWIECVGCQLIFETRTAAITHLKEHIKNGDKVPKRAIELLEQEMIEEGDKVEMDMDFLK